MPSPELPISSEAFALAKHIKSTRPTKKFSEKYLGPFKVIARPSSLAYKLQLPQYLSHIHPVFHVSQLEPVIQNLIPNCTQSPPPPIEVDGKEEFEVAKILDSKLDKRYRRCLLWYYIRWQGYEGTDEEFAWVAANELHANELLTEYHVRYPHKLGPLKDNS